MVTPNFRLPFIRRRRSTSSRRHGWLTAPVFALLVGVRVFAAVAPAAVPPEILGQWTGTVRHGDESGCIGFEFFRAKDGKRVGAKLWMPNLNNYGSFVGTVQSKDGELGIPDFNTPLTLEGDTLTGRLYVADLPFSLRRGGELPPESGPPPLATGPDPAWTFRADAAFWTSPVVAGELAYLGDAAGKFHAVQTADGKPRWSFNAGAAIYGNATVAGDAVYFAADNGLLYKLDRHSGAEIWRSDIGGAGIRSLPTAESGDWDFTNASPVVADGTLYLGSANGVFHALDTATGKSLWTFKSAGKFRAAALVANDRVYVGATDNFVYAFDRHNGAPLWRFDTGSPVTTAPVLAGDKLVIGTRDQALLYALDAASGQKRWTVFFWVSWVESSPVLAADGLLYIGSSDSRRVRAIDPATGQVRWAAQVWGWTWGTPLVVGDTVYFGTAGTAQYFIPQQASLGALDRRTGTLKWRRPLPLRENSYFAGLAGSLAFAEGKILAAGFDGTLQAFPAE